MKQFEVGKQYYMSSVCDHNCVWTYDVTDRTAKTVTLQPVSQHPEKPIKRRVYEFEGVERVKPLGSYSMAPILRADKEVEPEPLFSADPEPSVTKENPYSPQEIKDGFTYDCHFKAWNMPIDLLKAVLGEKAIPYTDMGNKLGFANLSAAQAREVKEISDMNGSILFVDDERPEPPKPRKNNVLDFTARLRAKQEQQERDNALDRFEAEYLPYLNEEDIRLLLSCPASEQGATMVKVCMRIDMERSRG